MAIRNIRIDGEDILRKKSKEVVKMTSRIKELIEDMYDTMYEAQGVGLAAPQVGILKRIFVADVGEEGKKTFINPIIIKEEETQTLDEGCLSLPGKAGLVTRPLKLVCKAFDEDMNEFTIEAEGYLARVISHETDHLEGILYKDKVEGELRDIEYAEEDEEESDEEAKQP